MSGGSHNCLYALDLDGPTFREDWQRIEQTLSELSYGARSATEMVYLRTAIKQLEDRLDRVRPVLKAVEWYESGDWSEEQLKEACAKLDTELIK